MPTKHLILKAVAGLDVKIKRGQHDVQRLEEEVKKIVEEEEETMKREEMERKEKEEKRQEEELKRIELERKAEQERHLQEHRKELQVKVDKMQRIFQEEQKQAQEEMEEHIRQVQIEERRRRTEEIKEQMEVASQSFDRDITKAQKALNKASKATTNAEANMATAVAEYQQSKEAEATAPELANESANELVGMVSSIIEENKRRAREAQLESLSLIPFTPGVEASSDPSTKTNEQWANEARQVTGLADALYTEPSESPYFDVANDTHALIEPLVTEYIRDKHRRLQDRWEELAEEYMIRKEIYDKTHTIRLAKEKSIGAKSVKTSILGSKPSAIGRGGIISAGERTTGNPYRRARRGNAGAGGSGYGDVVRSEYEQEQIIAELTAKEAMEKRIKHGGSKLPRQVCDLEKVCSLYGFRLPCPLILSHSVCLLRL